MTAKWKEAYDKRRNETMPAISCMVCGRKFFADLGSSHNTSCFEQK